MPSVMSFQRRLMLGGLLAGEVVQMGVYPAMQLVGPHALNPGWRQIGVEALGVELVQAAYALSGVLGRLEYDAGLRAPERRVRVDGSPVQLRSSIGRSS